MEKDIFDSFKVIKRINHTTKIVHINKEPYDVLISRPSKWGNPFTHIKDRSTKAQFIVRNRKEALIKYKDWIENGEGKYLLKDLHELKNKTLGCWCKNSEGKGKSCHGDVLIELINKYIINDETYKNI